jgi:microcystin degradation protein MlrC
MAPLRVAIGGIEHETNSFATGALGPTVLADFSRGNEIGAGPLMGEALLFTNRGVRSGIGGYMDTAPEVDAELLPLLYGSAAPSGTIADECYEYMRDELIARLEEAMPVDGVAPVLPLLPHQRSHSSPAGRLPAHLFNAHIVVG